MNHAIIRTIFRLENDDGCIKRVCVRLAITEATWNDPDIDLRDFIDLHERHSLSAWLREHPGWRLKGMGERHIERHVPKWTVTDMEFDPE